MGPLEEAIATVPPGRWAVGVSGGADSVALLSLARIRDDLKLHVVHLNHQLRGQQSDEDARFVGGLATRWQLPATIARRDQLPRDPMVSNPSAQYRRARLRLFADVVARHHLDGILLAHHQDDQIETVLQRLCRGSGYRGLCGMSESERIVGLTVRRPLLNVPRMMLRDHLKQIAQPWREDASNAADNYQRNRLRKLLARHAGLNETILPLMQAMRTLRSAVQSAAAVWPTRLDIAGLPEQPAICQQQSARVWLRQIGVPAERIEPDVVERLLQMIHDAASPSRLNLPGNRIIGRRGGVIALLEQ